MFISDQLAGEDGVRGEAPWQITRNSPGINVFGRAKITHFIRKLNLVSGITSEEIREPGYRRYGWYRQPMTLTVAWVDFSWMFSIKL